MTDREFVYKFLDKNFTITFNDKYIVASDKMYVAKVLYGNDLFYSYEKFRDEVYLMIYGDASQTNNRYDKHIGDWFDDTLAKILGDIINFIRSIKKNKGSVTLINRTIKKFSKKYTLELIAHICNEYYTKNYLTPNVNVFLEKLSSYGEVKGSKYLVKAFVDITGIHENEFQLKIAKKMILDWYEKNQLPKNIDKFLEQLVLILGPTNWQVKQIGGGNYNISSIFEHFPNEDQSMYSLISSKFNDWYEEEIVKASELEMKKAYHTTVGDLVVNGKIKINEDSIKDLDL